MRIDEVRDFGVGVALALTLRLAGVLKDAETRRFVRGSLRQARTWVPPSPWPGTGTEAAARVEWLGEFAERCQEEGIRVGVAPAERERPRDITAYRAGKRWSWSVGIDTPAEAVVSLQDQGECNCEKSQALQAMVDQARREMKVAQERYWLDIDQLNVECAGLSATNREIRIERDALQNKLGLMGEQLADSRVAAVTDKRTIARANAEIADLTKTLLAVAGKNWCRPQGDNPAQTRPDADPDAIDLLNDPRMDGETWISREDVTPAMRVAWPFWEQFNNRSIVKPGEVVSDHVSRPLRLAGMNERGEIAAEDMTAEHFARVSDWQCKVNADPWARFVKIHHHWLRGSRRSAMLFRPAIFASVGQREPHTLD